MKSSAINGAGLVGSLLSIILKRSGYKVEVFEKREDFSQGATSAGRSINLIITAKGVRALEELGLYQEIRPLCVPVYGRMMHDLEGKQIFQAYGKDKSEYNLSVSRLELNQKLLNLARNEGVSFAFQHELEDIDLDKNLLVFKNSKRYSYEQLFATDGAGSLIRHKLCAANLGKEETLWLKSSYKELLMPKGTGLDTECLHLWPRGDQFLMGLPNRDGSFTMTLYLEHERFQGLRDEASVKAHFSTYYPDTLALIPDLAAQFIKNPVGKLGTVFSGPWYHQNVLLLGDAAHAIVPFFGQGMNLGFNDCSYLQALLKMNETHTNIFNDFYLEQKKNADAIAHMALENFTEMQTSTADPSFLKLKKIESEIEQAFPGLYRSRYALITYTLVPYFHCQQIGLIQKEILSEVVDIINGTWNYEKASELIQEKLVTYYQKHKISLSTFKF
jgi:kynurenine 3-monooxygenase